MRARKEMLRRQFRPHPLKTAMLTKLVFRCPNTGMNVQQLLEPQPLAGDNDSFAAIHCPACARIHLVNRKTMKLLARENDRRVSQ